MVFGLRSVEIVAPAKACQRRDTACRGLVGIDMCVYSRPLHLDEVVARGGTPPYNPPMWVREGLG